jgi:hypothetical protein
MIASLDRWCEAEPALGGAAVPFDGEGVHTRLVAQKGVRYLRIPRGA